MQHKGHLTGEITPIIHNLDSGQTVEDVCREKDICMQTFQRCRRAYDRMDMTNDRRF